MRVNARHRVVVAGCLLVVLAGCRDGSAVVAEHGTLAAPPGGSPPGMVRVSAGPFHMGCNEAADTQCWIDERPGREVTLDAFDIDSTEVTVAAYEACVAVGGCGAPAALQYGTFGVPGLESHPVNYVTWYDARAYCLWAGKRLCTEAEWEKAARGRDGRIYPWGNEPATCERAILYGRGDWGCGLDGTWPVGSRPAGASPYGALDMAGNVSEWVADSYADLPVDGAAGRLGGPERANRGGAYNYDGFALRASMRNSDPPDWASYVLGFRCCRSAAP